MSSTSTEEKSLATQQVPPFALCPNAVGTWAGRIDPSGDLGYTKFVRGHIPCKRWDCPICGPRRVRLLRARVWNGLLINRPDAQKKYAQKFLTLTFPGQARRDALIAEFGDDAPKAAYEEMSIAFHKLIRALKKRFGEFHYLRVVEPQRDGFPHFHVLLVGASVIPKKILGASRALWWKKYALGSVHIRAKKPFESLRHAVNYILKYITKKIRPVGKHKRVFTAAQGALEKMKKQKWNRVEVFLGCVDHDIHEQLIMEIGETDEVQFHHIDRLIFKPPQRGLRPYKVQRSDWQQAVRETAKIIKRYQEGKNNADD